MNTQGLFQQLKNGLIVSCQALEGEPLHYPGFMACMAKAAEMGGAVGIRANGVDDIVQIRQTVKLPIIGLLKRDYTDSHVFLTPTMDEIDMLVEACPDVIATDATLRTRPGGVYLDDFYRAIRARHPSVLLMADCATYEEGVHAQELGFDMIGTTLSGYTEESQGVDLPNFALMEHLARECNVPVLAEGGIWTTQDMREAFRCGVHSVVIGSAITRPYEITKRFVDAIC